MALNARERLSAATRPVMRRWDRIPMRVQGRITVALPLLAVLVSATLAFIGNTDRVAIETDIQRKFEMTAALGNLTTLMVNAETGMRGYLLTGRTGFLEPFDEASQSLPGAISRLNALAAAEPGEKPRVEKLARVEDLRKLTAQQMADLANQRGFVNGGRLTVSADELTGDLANGKDLMDRIRGEVSDMQAEEQSLLTDRIADINAIRVRDYISVAVALAAAVLTRFVAWFLFRNGTLRRVERLTDQMRGHRRGEASTEPPPTKKDLLGRLEREVHLLRTSPSPAALTPPSTPRAALAAPSSDSRDDGAVEVLAHGGTRDPEAAAHPQGGQLSGLHEPVDGHR